MIYIDESGTLGSGGNRFFVIAAIKTTNPKRLKNIVYRFNKKHALTEIKGSELSVPQRQDLINCLNQSNDYSITYIVLDKNNFYRKDMLGKNVLFNYLCSFVCENVCRHEAEDVLICFDNRTVKTTSKHSLPEYLQVKTIEWGLDINIQSQFYESHMHRGIQIADLVSNTIFQRYKLRKSHFYDQLNIVRSIKFPYQHFRK